MSANANVRANAAISGAREGGPSGLERLLARAAARDLAALVVPGPEVARAAGLDLEDAGLSLAAGPRQASVLVVVGSATGLPESLERAAEVAYAQMPRPRATLIVGAGEYETLPFDARCEPEQASLAAAVEELRRAFREGAFTGQTQGFEPSALETRTVYTCSMHPEVEQDEPGQCPKCGMDLIPKESTGGEAGMHPGHGSQDHGGSESHARWEHAAEEDDQEAGEHAEHTADPGGEHEHGAHGHEGHGQEGHTGRSSEHDDGQAGDGDRDHGGRHEDAEGDGGHESHGGHDHGGHGEMDFMSMVEMTEGTPRSSDGLQMEWVDAPFGPLLPGLAGGLSLTFTLDGDTVAEAEASAQTGGAEDLLYGPAPGLVRRLSGLDPLSPLSCRLLATLALENAAGATAADDEKLCWIAALELERAASHSGWLSSFAHLLGLDLLSRDAAHLELRLRRLPSRLESEDINHGALQSRAVSLSRRLNKSRLLRARLRGVGVLDTEDVAGAGGPVARAAGHPQDLRAGDAVYEALGFEPIVESGSDALSRLRLRTTELDRSLRLARAALQKVPDSSLKIGAAPSVDSGSGRASVETPRGAGSLSLTIAEAEITDARLEIPSEALLPLAESVAEGRELGDALVGVASLDISPWGSG